MVRQTNAENLKDLIKNLGEKPKGKTHADLLDQLESLVPSGGSASDVSEGSLTEDDLDEIFGE